MVWGGRKWLHGLIGYVVRWWVKSGARKAKEGIRIYHNIPDDGILERVNASVVLQDDLKGVSKDDIKDGLKGV